MKIKAMVTKIDKSKGTMVVLTKDRQFKVLPLSDIPPILGSTIEISMPPKKSPLRFLVKSRWLSVAAVLLIFLTGLFGYYGTSQASTYVALDMKPSIQLAVSNNGQVTKVSALNEDGIRVINQLHLKSKNLYQAVHDIIKQAGKDGFLDKKNDNLVMAVYAKTKESGFAIDKNRLQQVINDELKNNLFPGYVVINNIDWKNWQKAMDAGYSANRMIIMESVKMHGIKMDQGTLNHVNMMQVMKNANISVPQLFPQNSYHVNLENQSKAKTSDSHGMMNSIDTGMHNNQKSPFNGPTNSSNRGTMMHSQSSSQENGGTSTSEAEKTNTGYMDSDINAMGSQGYIGK